MDQFEVEEEDSLDPPVDGCVRLEVRIIEHSFDVLGINLYLENLYSDKV